MGKREIYLLRNALASRRQPDHDTDHAKLVTLVTDFPYRDSTTPCFVKLLELPEFRHPSRGRPARPATEFLYQTSEIEKFLKEIELTDPTLTPVNGDLACSPDKFWEALDNQGLKIEEQWVPLARIAKGRYGRDERPAELTRRLLYWWTDLPLAREGLIRDMRRLGLPKNWFSGRCLLLRCRLTSEIAAATHVPSVLDGFASEIFLPAEYVRNPAAGEALDLTAQSLQPGAREFVLGPVDVQHIEIRAVDVVKSENDALGADSRDPGFQTLLENFYRSLL